jgi:hypothetical protein
MSVQALGGWVGALPQRRLWGSRLGPATPAKGSIGRTRSGENSQCVAVATASRQDWQQATPLCVPVVGLPVRCVRSGVLWGRLHGRVRFGCSCLRGSANGQRLGVRSRSRSRFLLASTAPRSPRRAAGGRCNLGGLRRGGQLLGLDPAPLSGPLGAIRGGPALGANDHVLAIRIRGRVGSRRRRRHRELGAWLPRASLHKPAIAVIGDSFQGEPVRGLWVLLASEVKERGRWMGSGCYWRSPFSRRAAGYAGWLNGP